MDFNLEQRLVITKAIIELSDPSRGSSLAEKRLRWGDRFEDGAMVVYDNDRWDLPSHHNRPLYVKTSIQKLSWRGLRLIQGPFWISFPYQSLTQVRAPRDRIMRESIKLSNFGGDYTYTLGFVNLDLAVDPRSAANRFHVINSQTVYHLLCAEALDPLS